ncbi:MAG: SRPBCC domain-containing protein [Actinomycetota bacterium]|jgi:uncharacterized protein YndB with AHSA1/START domain|nr:SRPBCC domain-containing protein [Actinomycetota bacterium]
MDIARSQLSMSRVVDAPRELVYRAFTDPAQFAAWWGPIGNSVLRDETDFDIRPGGHQRWTEVRDADPDFRVYIRIELTDVADGRLLEGVLHARGDFPDDIEPFNSALRIEFHDEPGRRTRLEIRQSLPEQACGPSEQGWREVFTKLDAALTSNAADQRDSQT